MVRRRRKLHFKNTSSKLPVMIFSISIVIGGFFLFRIISTLVKENGSTVEFTPVEIQSVTPIEVKDIDTEKEIPEQLGERVERSIEKAQKEQVKSPAVSEFYTIQVAAFKNRRRAENLVKQLKEKKISPLYVRTRGKWFEVWVGKFESPKEGERNLLKLKKDFSDAFTRKLQPPYEQM